MDKNMVLSLIEPGKMILAETSSMLINLLLVIIIFLIGWLIANLVKTVIVKLLNRIKLDELADRIELTRLLVNGGITQSLPEIIGGIIYWLSILVSFVIAINAVGLTIAADLLSRVVLFVPKVVAAIFILILGMFITSVMKSIVRAWAANSGIKQVDTITKIVEVAIMLFTVIVSMEQLEINMRIIEMTITILLASIGLAIALAFGLGCKEMAAKAVSGFLEKLNRKD
jgi:hypothetical protein